MLVMICIEIKDFYKVKIVKFFFYFVKPIFFIL